MFIGGSAVPVISPSLGNAAAMTINAEGMDAACGLPCCCSVTTKQFQTQYFIPPECANCISAAELSRLVEEGNRILSTTHMPVLPIIFTHFCIPFSPICIIAAYANSRQEKLRALCKRWNDEVFLARNCHIQLATFQEGYGRRNVQMGLSLQLVVHPGGSVALNVPQMVVATAYSSQPLASASVPMYEMPVQKFDGQQVAGYSNQTYFQPVPTAPAYAR